VAFFDYEIKRLENIIYSELELRPQVYRVDKQEIMMGLRDGINASQRESKIFISITYGDMVYHGTTKKIGVNQPLWCTITQPRDFMSERITKAISS
jgi:hypothetical protein